MGMTIEQAKKLDHFLCSDCDTENDASRSINGFPASPVSEPKAEPKRRKSAENRLLMFLRLQNVCNETNRRVHNRGPFSVVRLTVANFRNGSATVRLSGPVQDTSRPADRFYIDHIASQDALNRRKFVAMLHQIHSFRPFPTLDGTMRRCTATRRPSAVTAFSHSPRAELPSRTQVALLLCY
ncbi:BAH [Musa troglodytarum]|uniref:BAH n=1 Tax=Musa troglodytarum TaxID=320322 RepID=A0A9E7FGM1_9LILI|nr:BAH [Musa troglodytarum]